jgi:hypothetical protein
MCKHVDRIQISDLITLVAANQPTGLINVPGVAQGVAVDATDPHSSFCGLEAKIEAADVDMSNYAVIVSPGTRQILRTTPSFPGGSITTWERSAAVKARRKSPTIEPFADAGTT